MSQTDELLDIAFKLYNLNDFEQAEEIVREVLTISSTNGDALYLLGLIAYRANALEPSEKLLYQAVSLYPDNKIYVTTLASILQKENRLDEALSFYEKFQDDALVLSQIGFIYLQKGLNDFSQSAFNKALEIDKECVTSFIGEALIERRNNNNEQALSILLQAEQINKTAELMYQLSVQFRILHHLDRALLSIDQALLIEPLASFYNEKGLILEELGRIDEAQESYQKAIDLDSYFSDSFANLANVYQSKNMLSQAEDNYKRALSLDNNFLNAHHNLASLLYKQDRKTESLEHYRSALLINPQHISTLYNLAVILEEMSEYTEAAGLYFNILSLNAHPSYIDFRIASTLSSLGGQGKKEKKQALEFAKGWVKHFPGNIIARQTMDALNGKIGDKEQALQYAERLYDAFADSYDETMQKIEAGVLKNIFENLPEKPYKNILDLACGTGTFSTYLLTDFGTLTGVDISEKMLKKAEEKKKYTRLIQADAVTFLKTNQTSFDLILAAELICYMPSVSELLNEINSHLTPNGIFVLTIEETNEKEMLLAVNGRYLHPFSHIDDLLKEAHLTLVKRIQLPLRKEGTGVANGSILFCTKEKEAFYK